MATVSEYLTTAKVTVTVLSAIVTIAAFVFYNRFSVEANAQDIAEIKQKTEQQGALLAEHDTAIRLMQRDIKEIKANNQEIKLEIRDIGEDNQKMRDTLYRIEQHLNKAPFSR